MALLNRDDMRIEGFGSIRQRTHRRGAVFRFDHHVSGLAERFSDRPPDQQFIFDDEHSQRGEALTANRVS